MQECRDAAQLQLSAVSQLREADAADEHGLDLLEDQWGGVVQDAAAVVRTKEAQLQLVSDYCAQTRSARTELEQLAAELDAVRT